MEAAIVLCGPSECSHTYNASRTYIIYTVAIDSLSTPTYNIHTFTKLLISTQLSIKLKPLIKPYEKLKEIPYVFSP